MREGDISIMDTQLVNYQSDSLNVTLSIHTKIYKLHIYNK